MRSDLTDITIVLDRSGSMQSHRDDTEGGLNSFIEEQKKQPGDALVTVVQFDDRYEFLYKGTPIQEIGYIPLMPRGGTALLDAVGRAINETGERLRSMTYEDRPGLVSFVIITDGMENASREFTNKRVRDMITHQQEKYAWVFQYLGADQDAFANAYNIGINQSHAANYSKGKTRSTFHNMSGKMSTMRGNHEDALVAASYTQEDREEIG